MTPENKYYFSQLKKVVATVFLEHHAASASMDAWKGDTIADFQDDLFRKVKAKVSEKWFYTYFKNEPGKLPRIDMLNLLSAYVGHKNWHEFKASHKKKSLPKIRRSLKGFILAAAITFALVFFMMQDFNDKNEFHFCFVDAIKNENITNIALDIKMLQDEESPMYFKTDSLGCFTYLTKENSVRFVVQSPYHKTDTIIRTLDSKDNQIVNLTTDDYALMLNYYTNGNVKDWNKHKAKLQQLIADDAQIYQLFENSLGVEIFLKDDFIRLLTIPTTSLKRIKILERTLEHDKIVKLKFMVR